MTELLRMDFRRMLRSKMFYIGFLCLVAGVILTLVTINLVTDPALREAASESGMEITVEDEVEIGQLRQYRDVEMLYYTVFSGGFFHVALYIVAAIFVCTEFSCGFAKHIFSAHGKRWQYYGSKLLCMAAVSVLWTVGIMVIFRLLCRLGSLDFPVSGWEEVFKFIMFQAVIGTAFCAQAIFVCVWLRREGAGIALGITVSGGIVASLLDSVCRLLGFSVMGKLLYGSAQLLRFPIDGPCLLQILPVAFVWLGVWSVLAMVALYKKDI